MTNPTSLRRFGHQALVALVSVSLVVGPVAQPAYGALTLLADVPIAAKVAANPNIVYTVDDSGSMNLNYVPDFVSGVCIPGVTHTNACPASQGPVNFYRSGTGTTNPYTIQTVVPTSDFDNPPFLAAEFNRLAYEPDVTYTAPIKADGTSYPDQNAATTSNWTRVQTDPFLSPSSNTDLTNTVSVSLYCNSDWPADTTIGVNGEYQAGKGADCRINGTAYDSATNGAPAITANYNYPWQNTTGTGAQYFYRVGQKKTLYCNKAAAAWPQSCNNTTTYTCPAPQTYVAPVSKTQTCGGVTTSTSTSTNCTSQTTTYTPAGCNTNPAYGSPGPCVGIECLACNSSTTCTATTTTTTTTNRGSCSITGNSCSCTGAGCTPTCPKYTPNIGTCSGGATPTPVVTSSCGACSGSGNGCDCDDFLKGSVTTTLQNDADLINGGTGTVCRHNNQPGYAAGLFTYPSGVYTTKVTSGCPSAPQTVNIPRNYYKLDSVSFCNSTNTTVNAQWKGFGAGVCQSKNDLTTYINVSYGGFTRVDLVNDGRTFSYVDQVTGTAATRTYVQEMTNYANWYAYYRTRILAAKTVSSIAFSYLDNTYRVGFHTLGSPAVGSSSVLWVDPLDFNLAQKNAWYSKLFGISITNYMTPTLDAMLRIGNLFQTGTNGALTNVTPLPAPVKDPIQLSCQSNYHILFTDGYANQTLLPTVVGNVDSVVPTFTAADNPPDNVLPTLRPLAGSPWPKPFREGGAMANSLADIGMYYWATDLRPGLKNDVPAASGKQPSAPSTALAGDVDWTQDVAWWQHVNFSAISFGSDGILDASNTKATVQAIHDGTKAWPVPSPPNSPTSPSPAAAIDDLWHATVNARGSFIYARSPIEVSYGLASILAGIANQRKARVGAAFAGQVLDSSNNIVYQSTIEPGWAGDLLKVQIDPTTAKEVATLWQAKNTLAAQLLPASPGDEPWFTKRRVVTINDATNTPVPFLYANLSAAQLATFANSSIVQQKMIAYLRGGTTYGPAPTPTVIEGTGIGQFRKRFGPLGDITNGQPVIVGAPINPPIFSDYNDPGYSTYVSSNAARAKRIFVPSNDGMVHVLNDTDGTEVYAFIPKALIRSTVDSGGKPTGLQGLTYQDGGVPIYKHHFYVDSSPRAADVDFGNGTGDWHTIVVGGLGKGGNSYYALDATNATATNEAQAAAKVLWEFHDPDMVYTYGRPVIVKTRALGWVVIVTAGYNNVSGLGKIFFLNPKTGAKLYEMSTTAGSPGSPSGLAQINGFTKDFHNQIAEQIYGGDLMGNLWRFDVSDSNKANWKVDLFAKLTDPSGIVQPITSAPQIEIDFSNGIDRYVFVGTGQLLDTSDLTTPTPAQQQTLYAIRDGTLAVPLATGLPISPRSTMKPVNADLVSAIVGGAPNGWYQDLPGGQRIVVDLEADVNIVAYVGTSPQTDPCIIALPATIYAREYQTGASLIETDTGGGTYAIAPSAALASGAVGFQVVGMTGSDGSVTLGGLMSAEIPGTSPIIFKNPLINTSHRFSWRLLGGD